MDARHLSLLLSTLIIAGCGGTTSSTTRKDPPQEWPVVSAKTGAEFLEGTVQVAAATLTRESRKIHYRLTLKNMRSSPVRLKVWVRFFDDADVEYRKGETRWESVTLSGGASADLSGTFTMGDPTRLGITVLSE